MVNITLMRLLLSNHVDTDLDFLSCMPIGGTPVLCRSFLQQAKSSQSIVSPREQPVNMSGRASYSQIEKQFILDIVKTKPILTSNKNDLRTNINKRKAWEDVAKKFNSEFKRQVPHKNINQLYRKMKTVARDETSGNRKYVKGTGGGRSAEKVSPVSDFSNQISAMEEDLNHTIDNDFDDDYMHVAVEDLNNDSLNVSQSQAQSPEPDVVSDDSPPVAAPVAEKLDVPSTSSGGRTMTKSQLLEKEHGERMSVLEKRKQLYEAQLLLAQKQMEAEEERRKYYEKLNKVDSCDLIQSNGCLYRRL